MYAAHMLWNTLDLDIRFLPFDSIKKSRLISIGSRLLCRLILFICSYFLVFIYIRTLATYVV